MTTSSSERIRSDRDSIQNHTAIDLEAEIEAARQNLAELDRLRELAAARLTELDRHRSSRSTMSAGSNEWPAVSKLGLFRDFFRSREDVFAVRWGNHDRSRSDYSPRCANEWQLRLARTAAGAAPVECSCRSRFRGPYRICPKRINDRKEAPAGRTALAGATNQRCRLGERRSFY